MSNRKKKTHPDGYWTKEKVVEESKKYNILDDFNKSSKTAAGLARKNGWLDEMTWFKRPENHNKKWTKEAVLGLAKDCHTTGEIKQKSAPAYVVARKNGWFEEMPWLSSRKKRKE